MILLTIAIPTWNRFHELKNSLTVILNQLEKDFILSKNVEIVISDNDSKDKTESFVKKTIKKHPKINIVYHKQKRNVGGDLNVDNLFKISSGDYVWTLSDDDELLDESIKFIVSILKVQSKDIGMLFVNYKAYDFKMAEEINHHSLFFKNINESILFKNYKKMYDCTNMLGYSMLSTNIIKRDLWNNFVSPSFVGYSIIHCFVQYEIFLKNFPIYLIKEKLFKYRTNNNEGRYDQEYKNLFYLNFSSFNLLYYYKDKLPKKIWSKENRKEKINFIYGIAYNKSIGIKIRVIETLKGYYYSSKNVSFIPIISFLLLIPPSILRLIHKLKHF